MKLKKPVGSRSGNLYGLCKVHTASIFEIAKFLMIILKTLTTDEFTVRFFSICWRNC